MHTAVHLFSLKYAGHMQLKTNYCHFSAKHVFRYRFGMEEPKTLKCRPVSRIMQTCMLSDFKLTELTTVMSGEASDLICKKK